MTRLRPLSVTLDETEVLIIQFALTLAISMTLVILSSTSIISTKIALILMYVWMVYVLLTGVASG